MDEFRAYYSRWRVALLFSLCLAFVVLGLWMAGVIGEPPDPENWSRRRRGLPPEILPYIGWVSVVFFGIGLPISAKRFFDHDVQLQIGPTGIRWSQWSDTTIPWSEIDRISVWSYQRQKHIILHLHRPDDFPGRGVAARLARANRMMTSGDIGIAIAGTDRSFDEAMAAIEHFGGNAIFR
jgi:hypothetical protein